MKTTKIGAASALLIATLAVAFAPTAAAGEAVDCVERYVLPDEGDPQPGNIPVCETTHLDDCESSDPDPAMALLEQGICFVTG